MKNKKKILVSPLDWGLGHATRCIPVIDELIKQGIEVLVGSSGKAAELLKEVYPTLHHIELPDYNIKYHNHIPLKISILSQIPKLTLGIRKEQKSLQKIVNKHKINGIISDNRYGLYLKETPSVLITHQLSLYSQWFLNKNFQKLVAFFCNKHTQTWVPDIDNKISMAGKISKTNAKINNLSYIGFLSRFKAKESSEELKYDYLILISGPEPERTTFEEKIIKKYQFLGKRIAVVSPNLELKFNSIEIYNKLKYNELKKLIKQSKVIVSKGGYSTLMDLNVLQKAMIIYPTKGQPEQEYLAKYHSLNNQTPTRISIQNKSTLKQQISNFINILN